MDKKTVMELESILDKKFDQKLEPIKKTLLEHSDKLDSITLDMVEVQRKTDAIRDIHTMVKDTRETVKDHENRIEILENAA